MQVNDGLDTTVSYQFDDYALDPDARTLRCGDELVDLTPKVFTTLLVLVKNRDKVLTKDELLAIIWPSQFVDQSNLSQNISVLRKSLGEAESGKKYIATFPGRGYRFVGRVEVRSRREDNQDVPPHFAVNTDFETIPTYFGSEEPHGRSTSVPRHWNSKAIIALGVPALAAIIAFAILEATHHFAIRGPSDANAPVTLFARMKAGLTQPSWSRDGNVLAFVAMDLSGTRSALYLQSKGDIQAHSVLSDSGQYSSPAWSPDGKLLAFVHFQPDTAEIVIFDTQTQHSRILTQLFPHRYELNYRHLDWSPDGKFLVVDDKSQDSEPLSLYLIYIDNGRRVRLTYPDSDMIGDVSPRVSPDGTKVAFIRDIYLFEQELYVASVRGRTYQRITSAPMLISDIGWKANELLAFTADRGDGFHFWQLHLNKLDQKEIAASAIQSNRPLQFSVAQNGRTVAFSDYTPNLNIGSIDLTAPENPWVPVIHAAGDNIRPAISPDGMRLAFLSNASGAFQIWVSHTDGTNASPVATGALVPASFCWSSDGNFLIFSPQHVHGLYEVSVQSGSIRQISSIYTDPYSAIDNKSLFVRAHFFIYRIPRLGGSPQEVTEQGGAPIAQSRDGRYLYFSQGRMSTSIARLDLQTGHQEELISSLMPGYSDAWALSSRGIFFLGQKHSQPVVMFFNFDTDREEFIAEFPGSLPQIEMSGLGMSPDGKHLWVVRAEPMPSDIETTTLRSD